MIAGFALAVVASALFALLDGLRKHLVQILSPVTTAALMNGGQAVLLIGASLALGDVWPRDLLFYAAVAICAAANLATTILYLRALKLSPLSLTVPYLAFTPSLLLLTAWVGLGEAPTVIGACGVALVTLGAYLLPGVRSWRAPIAALAREPGSRLMLLVATIWAVTSAIDKWGVKHASPALYGGLVYAGSSSVTLAFTALKHPGELVRARQKALVPALLAGLVAALALFLQYASYASLPVSYTVAIKRAGMLGSVLIGWRFFGEKEVGSRLVGATIMVAGVLAMVLGG